MQTFVEKYVDFLTSIWTLVRINLQTAAEVRTFVQQYVNFLTSFWTGRRFSTILLNQVFVLYVFYHVLRNAPQTQRRTDVQTDRRTIKGFRAQPPGKPVGMRINTAAEVRTFVKKYVNFLTSFWTGRRFSAILLNWVFVLYVFYHVLRNAPHPAEAQMHRRTDD